MTVDRNREWYREYLDCLNARRFQELPQFVHDELRYNHRPMTRDEYGQMIAENVLAMPDLLFQAELLAVEGAVIGARLTFRCVPVREFLGWQPNGRAVAFAEHVFYRLRDGRIEEVWSLLEPPRLAE